MTDPTSQFKKAPRRKGDRGRRVTLSEADKRLYADQMRDREKRETDYVQHLPASPNKAR